MTPAQNRLVDLMGQGRILNWYGSNGLELQGESFWPSKRTVRALIEAGVLKWGEWRNDAQRQAGICPVELAK